MEHRGWRQTLFGRAPYAWRDADTIAQLVERLADDGERMRVYIPYGEDWYGYMIRRMAEKPANVSLFLKSLSSKN